MKEFAEYSKIADLLVRSMEDALSPEEQDFLDKWRKEDTAHETLYQKIFTESFWTGHPQKKYRGEIASAWMRLYERRQKEEKRLYLRKYLRISAAVVVLIIGCSALWRWHLHSAAEPGNGSVPGNTNVNGVELVLSNGKKVVLRKDGNHKTLDEEGAVIQAGKEMVQYWGEKDVDDLKYNTLRVPRGAEYKLSLADGTRVWLNAESEITYPIAFKGDVRKVTLKGEAFFDVAKDAEHPFIVHTSDFNVRVTGTKFNIRSYSDIPISTTLTEGSVQLERKGTVTLLKPGQQAILSGEKIEVKEVDVNEATAWRNNAFCFKNQTLENMLNEIARWYDLEVFYMTPLLKTLHFTAYFSRSCSIEEVIYKIERTQKVDLELKGKVLTVNYNNHNQ